MSYATRKEIDNSIKRYSSAVVAHDKTELRMGEAIHIGRQMKGGIRAYCVIIRLNLVEAQRLLRQYRKHAGLL